jgi:hypothetical protein
MKRSNDSDDHYLGPTKKTKVSHEKKRVTRATSFVNNVLPDCLNKLILSMSGNTEIFKMQNIYPEVLQSTSMIDLSLVERKNYRFIVNGMGLYNFTDDDLKYLPNLTSLNLWNNTEITDNGLKHLTNLTSLNLGNGGSGDNNKITDEGIKYLNKLEKLILWNNDLITDNGIEKLTRLTSLNLGRNDSVTDHGIKNLHNVTNLYLEENYRISYNHITHMYNLKVLDITNSRITTEKISIRLPNLVKLIGM